MAIIAPSVTRDMWGGEAPTDDWLQVSRAPTPHCPHSGPGLGAGVTEVRSEARLRPDPLWSPLRSLTKFCSDLR